MKKSEKQEKGNTERIRTHYTDREGHYKKEFYAICKQQQFSEEQITKLEKALYFQRPFLFFRMRHPNHLCTISTNNFCSSDI